MGGRECPLVPFLMRTLIPSGQGAGSLMTSTRPHLQYSYMAGLGLHPVNVRGSHSAHSVHSLSRSGGGRWAQVHVALGSPLFWALQPPPPAPPCGLRGGCMEELDLEVTEGACVGVPREQKWGRCTSGRKNICEISKV